MVRAHPSRVIADVAFLVERGVDRSVVHSGLAASRADCHYATPAIKKQLRSPTGYMTSLPPLTAAERRAIARPRVARRLNNCSGKSTGSARHYSWSPAKRSPCGNWHDRKVRHTTRMIIESLA